MKSDRPKNNLESIILNKIDMIRYKSTKLLMDATAFAKLNHQIKIIQ